MGKLLKPKDVAMLLDVDSSTVRGWLNDGKLPFIRTPGGQYRIDRQAVENLLAQMGQVAPAAEVAA